MVQMSHLKLKFCFFSGWEGLIYCPLDHQKPAYDPYNFGIGKVSLGYGCRLFDCLLAAAAIDLKKIIVFKCNCVLLILILDTKHWISNNFYHTFYLSAIHLTLFNSVIFSSWFASFYHVTFFARYSVKCIFLMKKWKAK